MTDLLKMCQSIRADLESPRDCDEDGTPVEDLGWTWNEDEECYQDEHGEECEHREQGGFDYINEALDIEFTIAQDRSYLGASVLVTFGGPNIRIDTRHRVIQGRWWSESCDVPYTDNIGIDDACAELFEMGN